MERAISVRTRALEPAFEDVSDPTQVICWADGHVSKSPPPSLDGTRSPDFDRLIFLARLDGTFVRFVEAGYRQNLPVSPPTACGVTPEVCRAQPSTG
jgi:hypothetical protein